MLPTTEILKLDLSEWILRRRYEELQRTTKNYEELIATTVEVALVFQGWVTSGGGEEKTKSGGMQVK